MVIIFNRLQRVYEFFRIKGNKIYFNLLPLIQRRGQEYILGGILSTVDSLSTICDSTKIDFWMVTVYNTSMNHAAF